MKYLLFFYLLITFISNTIMAQDAQFSQFYNNPVYINPALSGSDHAHSRFGIATRLQDNSIPGRDFRTYLASFDRYMPAVKGGVSLNIMNDIAGRGININNAVTLGYSYHQKISTNILILYGIQVGWNQNFLNWNKLTFGYNTVHDIRRGLTIQSSDLPSGKTYANGYSTKGYLDIGAGIALNSNNLRGGLSIKHWNRPTYSFIHTSINNRLPMLITGHLHAKFSLNKNFQLSPSAMYTYQREYNSLIFGLNTKYKIFTLGTWVRNIDTLIFSLGLEKDRFRFAYSYDLFSSSLSGFKTSVHEISFMINFSSHFPK